ncbi:hypothetical protein P7K49_000017 [Saguinus oedipus]|uniref:Uncharacterized protein n=1 Tax=Saguinus oedipus TaxID=9490 RepID=A0ABQ9WAI5_SAGOE|nr:hypothetical protein P7K49_000017 [Saguinus oedipus]
MGVPGFPSLLPLWRSKEQPGAPALMGALRFPNAETPRELQGTGQQALGWALHPLRPHPAPSQCPPATLGSSLDPQLPPTAHWDIYADPATTWPICLPHPADDLTLCPPHPPDDLALCPPHPPYDLALCPPHPADDLALCPPHPADDLAHLTTSQGLRPDLPEHLTQLTDPHSLLAQVLLHQRCVSGIPPIMN